MASDEFLRMCSSASRRVICIGCARNWFQMVLYHCDSAGERRQMFFPGPSMCFASKGDCTMCLGNSVLIHMESTAKEDRKSTRLNSSHGYISYAVFCLKKKKILADCSRRPNITMS